MFGLFGQEDRALAYVKEKPYCMRPHTGRVSALARVCAFPMKADNIVVRGTREAHVQHEWVFGFALSYVHGPTPVVAWTNRR